MTDKEKLDKLVAEIERRYRECKGATPATEYQELLDLIDSMQEEPKECMYSKDNYTDEDRKALCDGCEEKCEFNKKDEIKSVHAQHTTISSSLNDYLCKAYSALYKGNGGRLSFARLQNIAIDITEWQKQQMMKGAIDGQLENRDDYLCIKCLSMSCRPQDDGKLVKLIIIKED